MVDEKTVKGKAVSHSVGLAPPIELNEISHYSKTSFINRREFHSRCSTSSTAPLVS